MGTRIQFHNADDERWMSSYSRAVLDGIAVEAKIQRLNITSAIRTSEDQASTMYGNELRRVHFAAAVVEDQSRLRELEQDDKTPKATLKAAQAQLKKDQLELNANTVRYAAPGAKVQAVATKNILAATKDTTETELRTKTLHDMLDMIDKVGLINVTNHAGKFGLEVFDIAIKRYGPRELGRLRLAIRRQLGAIIYRFGSPAPAKSKYEFRDGRCFHVEILQPGDYERSAFVQSIG